MRMLGIIFCTLLISSCGLFEPKVIRVPVPPPDWPPASVELMKKCEELKELKAGKEGEPVRLNDLLNNLVENYTLHYKCSLKNDSWQQWYKDQKNNYEETVNKSKAAITGSK